jgi:homoserine/homoserine lactone efflux protein
MDMTSYLTFCVAAFALAVVPGPTVTVIVANSLRFGMRAGLLNVAGTVAAGLIWLAIAALGLTAAIQVMGVWFDLLRYGGAAYLIWLGFKLITARGQLAAVEATQLSRRGLFLQAFVVTMSNPKVLVLFGMMIPPFLSKTGNATIETLMLGGSFVAIATLTDTVYAVLAGRAGEWLSRSRIRAIEVISGTCLAAGGLLMVLKGR